jgi:hypothetical protein
MELFALLLVLPIGLYLFHQRGQGRSWGLVAAGEEVRGGGAYRETKVRLWKRGKAPWTVRVAAISSFFLGQMILPGALAALVGMIVLLGMLAGGKLHPLILVLQLSAPTGLVVAARLLAAGTALLNRDDDASAKARLAAKWALWHNVVLLAGLALAAALDPRELEAAAASALYCCVSIAQALVVRSAAASIDAYIARQEEDPAPIEAEVAILHEAS